MTDDKLDRLNDASAYQRCFACGARNGSGLKLRFTEDDGVIRAEFTADERYQGFPGVVHGGILATLLDETLSRTATLEGRWMMTGRLDIRYRSAAPIGQPLLITAPTVASRSRMVTATGSVCLLENPEAVFATAEGVFLPIPEQYQRDMTERHPELTGFFDI